MPDYANGLRSIAEGLTFNNAAESEALARAVADGDWKNFWNNYRQHKNNIESGYSKWAERNPGASFGGEFAGALVPGIVGAFVPGGQGATLSTVGRVGRAMAEPLTMAAERYLPNLAVKRGMPTALALADELGTGVVQSIGAAENMDEAPERILTDLPENLGFSLAVRGATASPIRRGAKKALSVVRRKPSLPPPPKSLQARPQPSMMQNYSGMLGRLLGV